MKKRDEIFVSQILERINLIQQFLKGKSLDFFLKSYLHKSAVIRELEVIGEAARLISNARGPLQVSDQTRKILADEKGELKDHYHHNSRAN